ncbi:MAG: hypothetical protein ACJAYU_002107 [Bradymonadia bacterium]|jgi:hypothetical protein
MPGFDDATVGLGLDTSLACARSHFATGQAWGDFDGDGWDDLVMTSPTGANALYRYLEGTAFEYAPQSADLLLDGRASAGASWADFDRNGDLDLYVLTEAANALFRNDAGRLVHIASAAGVDVPRTGVAGAWADVNADGYLDLYVVNWSRDEPAETWLQNEQDALFLNNVDGTFTDI